MKIGTISIQCETGTRNVEAIILQGLAVHPQEPRLQTYHRKQTVIYTARAAITHLRSGLKVADAHTLELAVIMVGKLKKLDWNKSMEELSESEEAQRVVEHAFWWHCRLMEKAQTIGFNVRSEEPITLVDAGGEG